MSTQRDSLWLEKIELYSLERMKRYGHWTVVSGFDVEGRAIVLLYYKDTLVQKISTQDPRFVIYEGSVPLSISLVVRHTKKANGSRVLEDDLRTNFGLPPPHKSTEMEKEKIHQEGAISLYWT